MIIELRRYIEVRELLIENRTTESQGHVPYWDGVWRVSVTRVAVRMEEKGMGMWTGYRGTYNWPLSWEWGQVCIWALWRNQRSISMQYDRNRSQEKRVGTLRSQDCQLSGQPTRWHRWPWLHDHHVRAMWSWMASMSLRPCGGHLTRVLGWPSNMMG